MEPYINERIDNLEYAVSGILTKMAEAREPKITKIKKLAENAIVPKQATVGSIGFDLHAYISDEDADGWDKEVPYVDINPNEEVKISTKLAFQLPENHVMLIAPRSSTGIKMHLRLSNTIGVLDADYRGECFIFIRNSGANVVRVNHGDRIVQALILQYPKMNLVEVPELDDTDRGAGMVGSTGKN